MSKKYPQTTKDPCHKCGSFLLLVDVTVEKMEGQHGDIITSSYQCSNIECQKESELEMSKLKKKKEERDVLNQKRLEKMKLNRKKPKK